MTFQKEKHARENLYNVTESAWLIPCMVLVINDNLYGLIFALSYICRCPLACLSPFVGVKVLLVLHVLESRCVAWSPFVGVKLKGRKYLCWSRLSAGWSTLKSKWRYAEECIPHLGVWGSVMWFFTKRSAIKKGLILIGLLFYRSHDVSGETGL